MTLFYIHVVTFCYLTILTRFGNVHVKARSQDGRLEWTKLNCIALNFTVNCESHHVFGNSKVTYTVGVILDYIVTTEVEKKQLLLLISAENHPTPWFFFFSSDFKWNCRWLEVPESSVWIIIKHQLYSAHSSTFIYVISHQFILNGTVTVASFVSVIVTFFATSCTHVETHFRQVKTSFCLYINTCIKSQLYCEHHDL